MWKSKQFVFPGLNFSFRWSAILQWKFFNQTGYLKRIRNDLSKGLLSHLLWIKSINVISGEVIHPGISAIFKSSKNFKRIIRWYKLYIASKDPCVFTPETLEENIKGQGSVICKFARRSRHLGWEFVICQQQIAQVYDQANKRIWWMPRQLEAMKDVVVCDKLGGAD